MKLNESSQHDARPGKPIACGLHPAALLVTGQSARDPLPRWTRRPLASLLAISLAFVLALACSPFQNAQAATTYTAGRTTLAPTLYTGQQNVLSTTQVTTGSVGGALTTVSVAVGAIHAAPVNHMQVALYADNGANAPGARVAQSETNVLQANAWNVFALNNTAIAANTKYWLVFNVDGSSTQVRISSVSGGRSTWKYPQTYGTWLASYGAPSRPIEARQYSMYMTYTSGPTTPPPLPPPPPPPPPPGGGTSGCGLSVTAGTTTQTIVVNGVQRTYLKVVPASVNANIPAPIIMGFHGGNDTAENANAYMGLTSADPVLYIYPQAGPFADAWAGWNVDPAGLDFPYMDAVLADLKAKHCVDATRVFATGKSNGGFFVNSLLCQRGASFKAAASVAGGGPQYNCGQPRAFMGVHGTADAPVPISKGRQSRDYWLAANQYANAAAVAVNPSPCVSYPGTLNRVVWCEHTGAHTWPSWASAGIRSFFLGL
jgi:polyhydroxybutyrate depolymerase